MSLPEPRGAPEPVVASRDARRCSGCSSHLQSRGALPFRTGSSAGVPEGAVTLELYWCPHCGKVEFFAPR